MTTIRQAIDSFLSNVKRTQPRNTHKNYKSDLLGVSGFLPTLEKHIKPTTPASSLSEEMAVQFLQSLLNKGSSTATRQRKAAAIREFYRFAIAMELTTASIEKMNYKIKAGKLLSGNKPRIEFPAEKLERTLNHVKSVQAKKRPNEIETLRNQAFIFVLAETGLRVSEACSLTLNNMDPHKRSAIVIGKGDKQAPIYFGSVSWKYLNSYLNMRSQLIGISNWRDLITSKKVLGTWPIFTRHDKNASKVQKSITAATGETIIHNWALEALGDQYDQSITCHSFRHFYVTKILDETGDLKTAQDLARHSNINTTANYAHRTSKRNQNVHENIFGKGE